ncbi:MAG: bifunctional oligoribonuclease/PAP phosphatase NrnA [Gemmatimonadota bacterium]|nr:MAG: bifunctional oligoribonuclease/PAP phosphatase NrnA [Gemmatimonadota bacterium]
MAPRRQSAAPGRGVRVPAFRRHAAESLVEMLRPGMRVALTTHVNADGDGCGSVVALWHLLMDRSVRAAITNPTPFPERYRFLLKGAERADKSAEAVKHLQRADAIIVTDISDLGRLGHLGRIIEQVTAPVACIDHHASEGVLPGGPRLVDPAACATGELIYDLAQTAGWTITQEAARALYVAIMTDTGGFRFSNTTPRALQVAAHLLAHGLDPEEAYRHVYASESEGRIRLIAEVLDTLVVEPQYGLAWVTVPPGALERHGLQPDDLEGVVEYPRSLRDVRLALLFRPLANGRVKVSFRSMGSVDSASLAERFGGGGHRKAAGASLAGDMAEVQSLVLAAARRLCAGRS